MLNAAAAAKVFKAVSHLLLAVLVGIAQHCTLITVVALIASLLVGSACAADAPTVAQSSPQGNDASQGAGAVSNAPVVPAEAGAHPLDAPSEVRDLLALPVSGAN